MRSGNLVCLSLMLIIVTLLSALAINMRQQSRTTVALRSAESNLSTAREAIDQLYVQFTTNALLHEPGTETLQKELLEKSLVFYDRVASADAPSPELRLQVALARLRVGEIRSSLDSPQAALPQFEEALTSLAELANEETDSMTVRLELATAQRLLGRTQLEAERPADAVKSFNASLATLQQLAQPGKPEVLDGLAESYSGRATAVAASDPAAALNDALRALNHYEELNRLTPGRAEVLAEIAKVEANRAVLMRLTQRLDSVPALYDSSLSYSRQAIAADPDNPELRADLTATLFNLGNVLSATGALDQALLPYAEAATLLQQLSSDFPLRHTFRIRLAKTRLNTGIAFARLARSDAATTEFREAIRLYETLHEMLPQMSDIAADLAQAWQNLGNVTAGDAYDRDPATAVDFYDQSITVCETALARFTDADTRKRFEEIAAASRTCRDEAAAK